MTSLRIKELREAAGLTRAELATRAGLTRKTLDNIEEARYAPRHATVQALAVALDISIADLLAEDGA